MMIEVRMRKRSDDAQSGSTLDKVKGYTELFGS
jgi:hypothetical protein